MKFDDINSDDVFTDGDEEVNWDLVDMVDSQIDDINAIEDEDERLAAAKKWVEELNG
jgi:hypothetical protein